VVGGEQGYQQKAQDELGKFLPQESRLVSHRLSLAAPGPNTRHNRGRRSRSWRYAWFWPAPQASGRVGVERTRCRGLGRVIKPPTQPKDRKPGHSCAAHAQSTERRIAISRPGPGWSQSQRRVFLVSVDSALAAMMAETPQTADPMASRDVSFGFNLKAPPEKS